MIVDQFSTGLQYHPSLLSFSRPVNLPSFRQTCRYRRCLGAKPSPNRSSPRVNGPIHVLQTSHLLTQSGVPCASLVNYLLQPTDLPRSSTDRTVDHPQDIPFVASKVQGSILHLIWAPFRTPSAGTPHASLQGSSLSARGRLQSTRAD